MIELLTICTGNVCRSPVAEALIRSRTDQSFVTVRSAGTRARTGQPMTDRSVALVEGLAAVGPEAGRHSATMLGVRDVERSDLVLAMTREHRRRAVELAPARLRSTFTLREFGRLAKGLETSELEQELAATAGPASRLRLALALVSARRGVVERPADPDADDVIDPYGRSAAVYDLMAQHLVPAVDEVVRIVGVVVNERTIPPSVARKRR